MYLEGTQRIVVKLLLLVAALSCPFSTQVAAQEHAINDLSEKWQTSFDLEIPEGFEQLSADLPEVKLALRSSRTGSYPTYNIIFQTSPVETSEAAKGTLAERVLEDYRRVGITDASLADRSIQMTNPALSHQFTIDFELKGKAMRSLVALAAVGAEHFVLTYISPRQDFQSSIRRDRGLFESFRPKQSLSSSSSDLPSGATQTAGYIPVALAVIILSLAFVLWKKRGGGRRS